MAKVDSIESLKFNLARYSFEPERPLFDSMTLEVPMNRNIYVTGPASAGKSTFLKLLAVLIQPEAGSYLVNGQDSSQMSFEEFLPYRLKIGYSFDFGGLFANRTILDNLTLGLLYHNVCSREEAEARARLLAEEFGFTKMLGHRPAAVPGGLRKLACVLRAFMPGPEMLVLDDPFTALDQDVCNRLIRLIERRRGEGETKHLFMTARHFAIPEQLGCEHLIVDGGNARFDGTLWKAA